MHKPLWQIPLMTLYGDLWLFAYTSTVYMHAPFTNKVPRLPAANMLAAKYGSRTFIKLSVVWLELHDLSQKVSLPKCLFFFKMC